MGEHNHRLIPGQIYKLKIYFYQHGQGYCIVILNSIDTQVNFDVACSEYYESPIKSISIPVLYAQGFVDLVGQVSYYSSPQIPRVCMFPWHEIKNIEPFDYHELPLCIGYEYKTPLFEDLFRRWRS
jgi:hypothetical protein